jgi:hypothetical protein
VTVCTHAKHYYPIIQKSLLLDGSSSCCNNLLSSKELTVSFSGPGRATKQFDLINVVSQLRQDDFLNYKFDGQMVLSFQQNSAAITAKLLRERALTLFKWKKILLDGDMFDGRKLPIEIVNRILEQALSSSEHSSSSSRDVVG